MDFPALARACAPAVHVSTITAVVRQESRFDPLVIGVNTKPPRAIRPKTHQEAVATARQLAARGINFDAGYGQINVKNWTWLGITPENVFDPCVNLAAAQRVLIECYRQASQVHGPGQRALLGALSCYNTGDIARGLRNGYVSRVVAGAGLAIPALQPVPLRAGATLDANQRDAQPAPQDEAEPGAADAFGHSSDDSFAEPAQDAFSRPQPSDTPDTPDTSSRVFGDRVPLNRRAPIPRP